MAQKHKMDFMKPTTTEALILANQAIILQALAIVIGNHEATGFINKAVVNIHDILERHSEDGV